MWEMTIFSFKCPTSPTFFVTFLFANYVQTGDAPSNALTPEGYVRSAKARQLKGSVAETPRQTEPSASPELSERGNLEPVGNRSSEPDVGHDQKKARRPAEADTSGTQNESQEAVRICGAETKKGTPCSRRVRNGVRCWQHLGKPAIVPEDQLMISH